jgi:C4-dicarboxylate-specific signal transduction histidine kinase
MADESWTAAGPLSPARLAQINRLATAARMVAGLAHELNNSLQVVSGLVELLSDRADIPADATGRIQRIGGQAEKATTAIRQVLGYTREFGPATTTVNLASAVEQALALRRYHLGRAGIAVTVDAPPVPVAVAGDDRSVLQVLLNLAINAEDALAQHPVRELRVAIERDGSRARVVVRDTGHGVPADIRERIFEPFFTTRTGERALGLGLPVAQVIAASLGGQVALGASGPGATDFVLDLPAV